MDTSLKNRLKVIPFESRFADPPKETLSDVDKDKLLRTLAARDGPRLVATAKPVTGDQNHDGICRMHTTNTLATKVLECFAR